MIVQLCPECSMVAGDRIGNFMDRCPVVGDTVEFFVGATARRPLGNPYGLIARVWPPTPFDPFHIVEVCLSCQGKDFRCQVPYRPNFKCPTPMPNGQAYCMPMLEE